MTLAKNEPPAAPPAAPAPTGAAQARLFLARRPTLRDRAQRRLTGRDWLMLGLAVLICGVGAPLLLRLAHTLPPASQPLGEALALLLATIGGALTIYTTYRRALLMTLGINRELLDTSKDLLSAVRRWVDDAYHLGQAEGRADYVDLLRIADTTQTRVEELERQLAERQVPLDAVDERILALLTADPTLTDEQIGADQVVALERSQVAKRRLALVKAGYAAAQKRRGRPARSA